MNCATDWGVFEYWNVGTVSQELIEFGKAHRWQFPKAPESLVGQPYKVAQCFAYHLNTEGKIDLMRQYLERTVSSVSLADPWLLNRRSCTPGTGV